MRRCKMQRRAPRTERSAEEQGDRGEVDQEERTKRAENLLTQDKARGRRQEGEGGSRQESRLQYARVKPARASAEK